MVRDVWYSKQLNTRITASMRDKLEQAADINGERQAEAVRTALAAYIRAAGLEVTWNDQ